LPPLYNAGLTEDDFLTGSKPTIADLSIGSNLFQLGYANAVPQKPNIKELVSSGLRDRGV
jgi:hypothetical protein